MIGTLLVAWIAFPALLLLLSAGVGLLVNRLLGGVVAPLLVVPLGFASAVLACSLLTLRATTAPWAGPLLAGTAVAGGVLALRARLGRPAHTDAAQAHKTPRGESVVHWASDARWAAGAALVSFLAIGAPVVLSGAPTWTGYGRIIDIAYVFDLATHLAAGGHTYSAAPQSAYQDILVKYLSNGYPVGGPATLGAVTSLIDSEVPWSYQPFLAFATAISSVSAYSLMTGPVRMRWLRCVGALTAALATPLYAYTLEAGIKERLTSCMLLLAAAVLSMSWRWRSGRPLIALAIALAAAFASLGALILPWAAVLTGGCLAALLAGGRRLSLSRPWLGVLALAALASLPPLLASFTRPHAAIQGLGGHDVGNLAYGVPAWAASGVWQTGDYRYPLHHHGLLNGVLIAVVLALAAWGVWAMLRRRQLTLVCLALAAAVGLAFVSVIYGPWLQWKAQTLDGPIVLLCSFCGIGALGSTRALARPWRRRLTLGTAATVIAVAVLYGDVLVYRQTTIAPYARMRDLDAVGARLAGPGPTLYPDFEEYAGYFLRRVGAVDPVANSAREFQLLPSVRRALSGSLPFAYDVDEFEPAYLQSFRYIVMRRNPAASRPPSNWDLIMRTPYHDVWERRRPAAAIRVHFPLSGRPGERTPFFCSDAVRDARRVGPGARIAYAIPAARLELDPTQEVHTASFALHGDTFLASGPGRATGSISLPASGRYELFLGGSFARTVHVALDGHPLAQVSYQESYPGQFASLGSFTLGAGPHQLLLTRAGADLHPGSSDGDGFARAIGPLMVVPAQAEEQVRIAPARELARVCAGRLNLDWLEILAA